MKAKFWICALLVGTAVLALAKEDPVLMTINGKDIKLSEFEYLYNKNTQQQVEKETLEQYVDLFVNSSPPSPLRTPPIAGNSSTRPTNAISRYMISTT